MNEHIHDRLQSMDIISHEPVKLRGGEVADYYVDIKRAYGDPELLAELADALRETLSPQVNVLAATGHGGLPLAAVLATRTGLDLAMVRDHAKNHGRETFIDGYTPGPEDSVAIVDDVFTTGSSLRQTIATLEATGANISGCHVIVKRGEGELSVPLTSLFEVTEFNIDETEPTDSYYLRL